jgi:hypothetical protein
MLRLSANIRLCRSCRAIVLQLVTEVVIKRISEISAQLALLTIDTVPMEAKQRIRARSAHLVQHRNQGNVGEFVNIFSPNPVFFDADGRTISGRHGQFLKYLVTQRKLLYLKYRTVDLPLLI